MANELYPIELSGLQSKNALHTAHAIKTASDSAEEGQSLLKTEDGYTFGDVGGAIDHILVNGTEQTIVNKTVDLEVTEVEEFEQFQQIAVRVDQGQSFTDAQKAQARSNIGVNSGGTTGAVDSVNGQTGTVVITGSNINMANDDTHKIAEYGKAISNPNLIMNPWFSVNQRRVTTPPSTNAYFVDRFKAYSTTNIESTQNGLVCTLEKNQGIEYRAELNTLENGRTYTVSIKTNEGTFSASFEYINSSSYKNILIASSKFRLAIMTTSNFIQLIFLCDVNEGFNGTIRAVKIELGSVSTLANDTAPDYATELLKCQRYFYRLGINAQANYAATTWTATEARVGIPLPSPMRISNPTVSIDDVTQVGFSNGTGFINAVALIGINIVNDNAILALSFTIPSQSIFLPISCRISSVVNISADL